MKKFMLLFAIMCMASASVFSQTIYYRCTGDNVNIRKGPGTNYAVITGEWSAVCGEGVAQLYKYEVVRSDGKVRNGFMHVMEGRERTICWEKGWVSAKYLTRATKCKKCNGRGNSGRPCPQCNGYGGDGCCLYTGMDLCSYCDGVGYN